MIYMQIVSFVKISPPVPEIFKSVYPFLEIFEDFFFTIYGHGGHLSHVTWIIYILSFPLPIEASYEIWF